MDDALVRWLNGLARRHRRVAQLVSVAAARLAAVEVALMVALAIAGRRRSALRMLLAVATVYVICEVLGIAWPRARPFERLHGVVGLAPHDPGRSFPSRHVASGLAMAAIGGRDHPRLGAVMAAVAWLLGASRVAAGLHYPTDVLAGAVVGRTVAWCTAVPRRFARSRRAPTCSGLRNALLRAAARISGFRKFSPHRKP